MLLRRTLGGKTGEKTRPWSNIRLTFDNVQRRYNEMNFGLHHQLSEGLKNTPKL